MSLTRNGRSHQVTVLTLELDSPTLPAGKQLIFNLKDTAKLADTKKNPIIIKEGIEYKCVPSHSLSSRVSPFISVRITFKVNHSIISVCLLDCVDIVVDVLMANTRAFVMCKLSRELVSRVRAHLLCVFDDPLIDLYSVDKLEQMLGSYGPHPKGEAYTKNFDPEESPSGVVARSGSYSVRSRVVDDDGEVYAGMSLQAVLEI